MDTVATFNLGGFPHHSSIQSTAAVSLKKRAVPLTRLELRNKIGLRAVLQSSSSSTTSQWDLFVRNYNGNWVGKTTWYDRDELRNTLDFQNAAEAIESRYNISFSDPDTGIWEGYGLRFSNGTRILPLSRSTYNLQGSVWQFPGAGGLGSLVVDQNTNKSMQEVYFFHENVGAMILVIFSKEASKNGRLVLKSVGTLPFVRQSGSQVFAKPELDTHKKELRNILDTISGWQGQRMSLGPKAALPERSDACGKFDSSPYLTSPFSASLEAGLVLAVPEYIDSTTPPFEMRFGCLQSRNLFKQVVISFDAEGKLAQWTYDVYSPPAAP